jgi:hypothetical protein
MTAALKSFAWLALNDATDDEGFYLEDGPTVREAEREELREAGAPDVDAIVFVSILPEDRDDAMVEALVTDAFIEWAKGEGDLVWYDETSGDDAS